MTICLLDGRSRRACLSMRPPTSSSGAPVLVLSDGVALGPGDCAGLRLVVATARDCIELERAGFGCLLSAFGAARKNVLPAGRFV